MAEPPPKPPASPVPSGGWDNQDSANQIVQRIHEDRRRRFVAATNSGPSFVPAPLAATLSADSAIIANATVQKARPLARTEIGKAVLRNVDQIELIGWSFVGLIDDRIAELRRLNNDEAHQQIVEYEDLKRRVEEFLGAAAQFAANKVPEQTVESATLSFADGLKNIWARRHLQIFDVSLFGIALGLCQMADPLSVCVAGAVVGGQKVVDAIKAVMSDH